MNILIVNAWGGNRGDEAMINSIYEVIRSIRPDARVSLLPFRDEKIDVTPDIRLIQGRVGAYYYSSLSPFLISLDRRFKNKLVLRVLLFLTQVFGCLDMAFMRGYDLVIHAPQGPTIGDLYVFQKKILYPLSMAGRFGIPYAVLGVSAGPFKPSKISSYTGRVLRRAEATVVREDVSYGYIHSAFPDLKNVVSSIDIVFATSLKLDRKPQDQKELYSRYLASMPENAVGACISLTPSRDPLSSFDKEEYIEKMIRFFEYMLLRTKRKLVLFPHVASDLPWLERITDRLKGRVDIFPAALDSDFHQDILSKLEFFVSSRYHPTIFAIKSATPFMCIKNQFKVEGMMAKLGLQMETCWQDDPLDELQRVFDLCWDKRRENISAIERAMKTARSETQKYITVLSEMIGSPAP